MRKRGFLRQNTKACRDEGQVTLVTGLFFILFFSVLSVSFFQMEMIRSSSRYMEDALAASGLACALIDVREYGSTHVLKIQNGRESYEIYCKALKANLGLDDAWESHNHKLISGVVQVEAFYVYNVLGESVDYCRLDDGREEWMHGSLGEVSAPNGQVVEKTGVYGEISYPLKGIWGLKVQARKGKLVDVVGAD